MESVAVTNATKEIVIQASDPNTMWLVLATFVLAGITFLGIWLTNKRTRESNELTRKELDSKIRAWLRIDGLEYDHVVLKNGLIIDWNEYWTNTNKYTSPIVDYDLKLRVSNIGSLPAINVVGKLLHGFDKLERNALENGEISEPLPLMPGESFPKEITISEEDYKKTATSPYYIGLLVEYKIDDKTNAKVGKIWIIQGTYSSIYDSWI